MKISSTIRLKRCTVSKELLVEITSFVALVVMVLRRPAGALVWFRLTGMVLCVTFEKTYHWYHIMLPLLEGLDQSRIWISRGDFEDLCQILDPKLVMVQPPGSL